jgi:hypothetical protein
MLASVLTDSRADSVAVAVPSAAAAASGGDSKRIWRRRRAKQAYIATTTSITPAAALPAAIAAVGTSLVVLELARDALITNVERAESMTVVAFVVTKGDAVGITVCACVNVDTDSVACCSSGALAELTAVAVVIAVVAGVTVGVGVFAGVGVRRLVIVVAAPAGAVATPLVADVVAGATLGGLVVVVVVVRVVVRPVVVVGFGVNSVVDGTENTTVTEAHRISSTTEVDVMVSFNLSLKPNPSRLTTLALSLPPKRTFFPLEKKKRTRSKNF